MDNHQRQLHFHLAWAIMHLNYIASLLPFFGPDIKWGAPAIPSISPGMPVGGRSLHTFVPMPRTFPSHMVVNPEHHLRPMELPMSSHSRPGIESFNPAWTHQEYDLQHLCLQPELLIRHSGHGF